MRHLDFVLPDDFNLFHIGDNHLGNSMMYERGYMMALNALDSEWGGLPASRNVAVHVGDIHEGIYMDDYRFDPGVHDAEKDMYWMVDASENMHRPYAKKFLVWMDGNHSNTRKLRPLGNSTYEHAKRVGGEFGTYQAVLTFKTVHGTVMFRNFVGHGWGSISSKVKPGKRAKANREISLMMKLAAKASNCMLMCMGHTHQLEVYTPHQELYMRHVGGGKIIQGYTNPEKYYGDVDYIPDELRYYANTGSFLKLYRPVKYDEDRKHSSGYAEMAGYDPVALGFTVTEVRNGRIQAVRKIVVDEHQGFIILSN